MSNNCSQRSNKLKRNKRKFHFLDCECFFCKTHVYPNPIPDWECFCKECTNITHEEMENTLLFTDIDQFLRRANNVECTCGLCATCVSCAEFFYTIYQHRITRDACNCPFCTEYNAVAVPPVHRN